MNCMRRLSGIAVLIAVCIAAHSVVAETIEIDDPTWARMPLEQQKRIEAELRAQGILREGDVITYIGKRPTAPVQTNVFGAAECLVRRQLCETRKALDEAAGRPTKPCPSCQRPKRGQK